MSPIPDALDSELKRGEGRELAGTAALSLPCPLGGQLLSTQRLSQVLPATEDWKL